MTIIDQRSGDKSVGELSQDDIEVFAKECDRQLRARTRFFCLLEDRNSSDDVMKYSPKRQIVTVRRATPALSPHEISDPALISDKLVKRPTPAYAYLWEQLSSATRDLLEASRSSSMSHEVKALLAKEFNGIIRCGRSHDIERVLGLKLNEVAARFLDARCSEELGVQWQHRLLLEHLFWSEISRNPYVDEPLAIWPSRSSDRQHLERSICDGSAEETSIWIPPQNQYQVALDREEFLEELVWSRVADEPFDADGCSTLPNYITKDPVYIRLVADGLLGIVQSGSPKRSTGLRHRAHIVSRTQVDLNDLPLTEPQKAEILTALI